MIEQLWMGRTNSLGTEILQRLDQTGAEQLFSYFWFIRKT